MENPKRIRKDQIRIGEGETWKKEQKKANLIPITGAKKQMEFRENIQQHTHTHTTAICIYVFLTDAN